MLIDVCDNLTIFINWTDKSTRQIDFAQLKSKTSYHCWVDLYFFSVGVAYGPAKIK